MSTTALASAKELSHDALADGLCFGESPRYRDGLIYVSDMIGRKIYTIDASSGAKQVLVEVENQPNGLGFLEDGSLIYSSMFDAKLYRLKDGKSTLYSDMSHVMKGYCGDMVIDSTGRVYLDDTGARVLHGEAPKPGRMLIIDTDGSARSAEEDIVFPNAVLISNDGRTLFVAETFRYGLLKFDISPDGQLSNRQKVWTPAVLVEEEHNPADSMIGIDGGCMDSEGGIWLSMLGFEQFIRLGVDGIITHRIKVDGHATACTLGGPDGKTLYLVVNKVPEDKGLFKAMVAKETRCFLRTARVEIGRGTARP